MQCSKETIVRLFYNVSSSFQLFLLFSYLTSILLAKILLFLGGNNIFFQRNQTTYDFATFSDEEVEDEDKYDDYYHSAHIESIRDQNHFAPNLLFQDYQQNHHVALNDENEEEEEIESVGEEEEQLLSTYSSPTMESNIPSNEEVNIVEEEIPSPARDNTFDDSFVPRENDKTTPNSKENMSNNEPLDTETQPEKNCKEEMMKKKDEKRVVVESSLIEEDHQEKLIIEGKKLQFKVEEKEEIIYGETYTVGSTSKSSSEWRSSIKDSSCTEDPFSSSSRRSCTKWESYAVFQKYDEDMLFFDRISAQKLNQTQTASLRSIQSNPRSISDRIVYKFAPKKQRRKDNGYNENNELEGAYVAQICLTWEALNWNYKHFQSLKASKNNSNNRDDNNDDGCPAYIAQQFQQFQVLLRRYIENEPFERGKRPLVYARIRSKSPKLLQVPQFRDSEEENREGGVYSRIPSDSFLKIMEEAITTFMDFLKADRESHCQEIASFFKKNNTRGSADPILLLHLKKENKKKRRKVKEVRKSMRKRRLKVGEEMEILMGEIEMKVVSRVLRMRELSNEQLRWCEDKMSKVRISSHTGKLHRDSSSSPLFFPSH